MGVKGYIFYHIVFVSGIDGVCNFVVWERYNTSMKIRRGAL